jgi:hypothetical protein
MDDLTFDFDEARAEMRGAIEAQDTEEIIGFSRKSATSATRPRRRAMWSCGCISRG